MLTRKVESLIASWVKNDKKALLVDGARQVGKTFIIRKVLNDLGCDFIEFNLIQSPEIISLLAQSESVDALVTNLSLFADKPFVKGRTFLFIDEIQEFKEIATKLKFWVDEGSFRYVFSGSLLGVTLQNVISAPVGYLKTLTMHPLDFEEFLQIYNFTDSLKKSLYQSFIEKTQVNETVHDRMMRLFNLYLNIGGMPAAVQRFSETKSLEDVVAEHTDIVAQYKKDFTKYETEEKRIYLNRIYDLIPAELNKPNKRFLFADLKKGLRHEKSAEDFLWLSNAGVALPVYNVAEPSVPLRLNENSSLFKFFLSDVGMLTSLYGKTTKMRLLSDNPAINFGAIYENVAAQELKAHGFDLYYYNSKRFGELDFVIEYRGKVLPIEIKSGKDYKRHHALNNILEIPNYEIGTAVVFTNGNVEVKADIVYYPMYMLMFLTDNDIQLPTIDTLSLHSES